ncbi:ESPR-type extended signal peptide-containing protein, partial [Escherichia albertii]
MNKIFKVIWNPATGSYSVANETAKSRGKKSGRSKLLISALVAGGLLSSFGVLANAGSDTGDSNHSDSGTGWIAIGSGAVANSYTNVDGASEALGYYAKALGKWSTAIGSYSESNGDASLALGVKAKSNGNRSISMGASSQATDKASYAISMGVYATTDAANAVALGYYSKALGLSSLALGYKSEAHSENGIAMGTSSKVTGTNSLALGSNTDASGNNAIALGAGSVAGTDNTVSVGSSTTQRKIVNMDKGEISNTSTEAINGSQLYAISKSVSDRLGGGSSVNTNGTVNAPTYALKSGTYNNVGAALTGIDEDTLHWNSASNKFSASHGSSTTNIITNVADGDVAAGSTDAINGSQLKATKDDVAANTTSITNLSNDVADNTTNINNLTDAIDTLGDDALQWDSGKTAFSAAHGASTTSKITNVADGSLAAGSTDAVNGSQLKTTNDNVTTNTTNITNLQDAVDGLGDDA